MNMAKDVLKKMKGTDKIDEVIPGKGAFSKQGFSDLVNAIANDTTFTVKTYSDGKETGEINISELLRADLKKTLEKAKYPQKTEAGVLDNCEISTSGLAQAIPLLVMEQMKCGKKFDLPQQEKAVGSIYLAESKPSVKTVKTRDPKTQKELGTCETTNQACLQIKAKSPVPKHLQKKVHRDPSGKIIQK